MVNFSRMTHSMYCDKKQKRVGECDDLDHIPSAKRLKTRSNADSETACPNHQNSVSYSNNPAIPTSHKDDLFQTTTHVPFPGLRNENHLAQSTAARLPAEECSLVQPDLKYLPDLNAVENPYYYENNKLLFELYVERIQRATISHLVCPSQHHPF